MKNIIFTIATITLFTACNKDKEAPVINITSPSAHTEFMHGDTIHLMATFTDDIDLSKLHAHVGDANGNHISDFHWEEEIDLSGTSHAYHSNIIVPMTTAEMGYIHLEVTDAESKTTSESVMIHFH